MSVASIRSLAVFLAVLLIVIWTLFYLGSVTNDANDNLPDIPKGIAVSSKNWSFTPPPHTLDSSAQDDEREMDYATLTARYELRHNRPPPIGFDKWYKYAKDHKCYLERYDSIYRDLAPFAGMTREEFFHRHELAKNAPHSLVIRVKDGKVQSEANYYVTPFVQFLPDMEFVANVLDEPRVLFDVTVDKNLTITGEDVFYSPPRGGHAEFIQKFCRVYSKERPFVGLNDKHGYLIEPDSSSYTRQLLPILSPTRIDPCFSDILVPSGYYGGAENWPSSTKWEDRISDVFWRGKTSGGHATGNNYENFHRQRMTEFHKKNATLYNIAFTGVVQCDSEECQKIMKQYPFLSGISFEENFNHKYLVDIDGNTFSGRFLAFLFSGSLVFKTTIFSEFFRDWLIPYVHYIPVEMDLSDLDDKVQWALRHERDAKQIALNGQRFARKHLQEGHKNCYTFLLMLELARLQGTA